MDLKTPRVTIAIDAGTVPAARPADADIATLSVASTSAGGMADAPSAIRAAVATPAGRARPRRLNRPFSLSRPRRAAC